MSYLDVGLESPSALADPVDPAVPAVPAVPEGVASVGAEVGVAAGDAAAAGDVVEVAAAELALVADLEPAVALVP